MVPTGASSTISLTQRGFDTDGINSTAATFCCQFHHLSALRYEGSRAIVIGSRPTRSLLITFDSTERGFGHAALVKRILSFFTLISAA